LTVDQVHKILKRNVARAGLDPKRFKLHGLRHMFAQQLDQAGARIQDISQGLGHALMNTTQIYLNRLRGPAGAGLQTQLDEIRKKSASIARDAIDV
jgi:site-specific recombinase XerD